MMSMAAEPTRGGGGASNPRVALAFKEVAPRKGARGHARGRPPPLVAVGHGWPTVSGTAPTASARDFRLAALDDLADTLCHYTTADAAFGHIVPSGELRMSPYARMRDPLENRELPSGGGASGDETEAHVKLMDRIVTAIRNVRDATRLLSFTVDAREGYTDSELPFMRAWACAHVGAVHEQPRRDMHRLRSRAGARTHQGEMFTRWASLAVARWSTRLAAFAGLARQRSCSTNSVSTA
jgi:hypothetical protein